MDVFDGGGGPETDVPIGVALATIAIIVTLLTSIVYRQGSETRKNPVRDCSYYEGPATHRI